MLGPKPATVQLWRDCWVSLATVPRKELSSADRLADVPRPGVPAQWRGAGLCALRLGLPARVFGPCAH